MRDDRAPGEATADVGDDRWVRSNVFANVLSVVGVAVDRWSGRLLVELDVLPYIVESDEVCKDSLGRLVGGIGIGLGRPSWLKDDAEST